MRIPAGGSCRLFAGDSLFLLHTASHRPAALCMHPEKDVVLFITFLTLHFSLKIRKIKSEYFLKFLRKLQDFCKKLQCHKRTHASYLLFFQNK